MIIHSGSESLSFAVDHYQYPKHKRQEKGYDYDANWLVIAIRYCNQDTTEEYKDACLLTYELEELVEGLSKVLDGEESLYISDFMEPYLKIVFAMAENKILFGLEFVYDTTDGIWKSRKGSEVITRDQAMKHLDELNAMRSQFPQR